MLEIIRLSVSIDGKRLIDDVSLTVGDGETLLLFGPNGSGKSTLLKAVAGIGGYRLDRGDIVFNGRRLNDLPVEERIRLGMGIMYQHPPAIRGVTLRQVARYLCPDTSRIAALAETLSLDDLLDRELNLNFSGGEAKRAELFQVLLQDPSLLLLDEPESGVDIENVALMGRVINDFLRRPGTSAFIITHTGYVMEYVPAQRGCVMLSGRSWCMKDPKEIFRDIREEGYEACVRCDERKTH